MKKLTKLTKLTKLAVLAVLAVLTVLTVLTVLAVLAVLATAAPSGRRAMSPVFSTAPWGLCPRDGRSDEGHGNRRDAAERAG